MVAADQRRAQLATIHVARQQLAMDDDAYRDMLARVSGEHGTSVRSAADLTGRQRTAVIEELRRLGAAHPKGNGKGFPGRPHNIHSKTFAPELKKIEALLADMKLSWAYADAIVKRQCGIAKAMWARKPSDLNAVITALVIEQEKRALLAFIETRLQQTEQSVDDLLARRKFKTLNWRRHRPTLKDLAEQLGWGPVVKGEI